MKQNIEIRKKSIKIFYECTFMKLQKYQLISRYSYYMDKYVSRKVVFFPIKKFEINLENTLDIYWKCKYIFRFPDMRRFRNRHILLFNQNVVFFILLKIPSVSGQLLWVGHPYNRGHLRCLKSSDVAFILG